MNPVSQNPHSLMRIGTATKPRQGQAPSTRPEPQARRLCDDPRALESLRHYETRLSAGLRRTLKLLDAQLKNQKLHDEPSDAQTPRYDHDRLAAEAPLSTIHHPPSTTSEAAGDGRSIIERDVISASAIAGPSAKADLFLGPAPMSRR